jgi:hypothetical protein
VDSQALAIRESRSLTAQKVLGWLTFAAVGPGSIFTMRVIRNNRVAGMPRARQLYRDLLANGRPTLICANHLTMVDSAYLHWSLSSMFGYLANFRRFSWNVPAIEHFNRNPFLRAICYLGKTVPIDRGGDDAHRKAVMEKLKWLVEQGEVVTLFPEGSRSRTGRIDDSNLQYGIGQLLVGLNRPQVLCAYLRGLRQGAATGVPPWGDVVDIDVDVLEPSTTQTGMRAWRDLSRQVIDKLKSLEDAWFARRGTNTVMKP